MKRWRAVSFLSLSSILEGFFLSCSTPPDSGRESAPAAESGGAQEAGLEPSPETSEAPAVPEGVDPAELDDREPQTIADQRERLFRRMRAELHLSNTELDRVQRIFDKSEWMSQGNPKVVKHPMTRAECRKRREEAFVEPVSPEACGAPNMVPIYSRSTGETEKDARVCVDQFEFPNIACEYPVVWVRASEAAALCEAVGKRICDAHEWEGSCAGDLQDASIEYNFRLDRKHSSGLHNLHRPMLWAYGERKNHALCATQSFKSEGCNGGDFGRCGSNTYPSGSFPECKSPFGVFDLHGNAAEHMNIPTKPSELASRGGKGETEMKGSWFIFSSYEAHPDDCRFRAPTWHNGPIASENSHMNYHLGFRCCKDIEPEDSHRVMR